MKPNALLSEVSGCLYLRTGGDSHVLNGFATVAHYNTKLSEFPQIIPLLFPNIIVPCLNIVQFEVLYRMIR